MGYGHTKFKHYSEGNGQRGRERGTERGRDTVFFVLYCFIGLGANASTVILDEISK